MYVGLDDNLTEAEAEEIVNQVYDEIFAELKVESSTFGNNCGASWQLGRECVYNYIVENSSSFTFGIVQELVNAQAAAIAGLLDGLLGTIEFLWKAGRFILNVENVVIAAESYFSFVWDYHLFNPNSKSYPLIASAFKKLNRKNLTQWGKYLANGANFIFGSKTLIFTPQNDPPQEVIMIIDAIGNFIKNQIDVNFGGSTYDAIAYLAGVIGFEAILADLTVGGSVGIKGAQVANKLLPALTKGTNKIKPFFDNISKGIAESGAKVKKTICKILLDGCFVKDTPVLMAGNPFKNVATGMALAAMPLVAPIQDVQVDDMVIAYHHVEITDRNPDLAMASIGEDMYLTAF